MPAQRPHARNPRRKKKTVPLWIQLWPLYLGILVTPFAVRGASVLALNGPSALRTLYPYVVLAQAHFDQFANNQEETISQWTMYGQFPVYGLIWVLARRIFRGSIAPLSVLVLHCSGVAAAILTSTK